MGQTTRLQRALIRSISLTVAASLAPAAAEGAVYEVGNDGVVRTCGLSAAGTTSCASAEPAPVPEPAPEVPPAAVTTIAEPAVPPSYRAPLLSASSHYQVSPRLLAALASRESAWRSSAVSPKGAIGLTQLMPATARAMAVDPRDPAANLDGGARYLRQLLDRFDGDIERALAAYNAGPGRVLRAGGVPAISETRTYVASIVDRLGAAAR